MKTGTTTRVTTTALALAIFAGLTLSAPGCAGSRAGRDDPVDSGDIGAEVREAGLLVREAQRYEVAGDDARAIEQYQRATQAYNEMPVAWNNLGRLLMKRGENLAAANAFKTASELSPTDPRPMYNLGALWEQLGYYEDAEHWYDEALIRDQRHLPSLRRAILVDQLRDKVRPITAERLKIALLMEREPWWLDRFKRYQIHLRASLSESGRAHRHPRRLLRRSQPQSRCPRQNPSRNPCPRRGEESAAGAAGSSLTDAFGGPALRAGCAAPEEDTKTHGSENRATPETIRQTDPRGVSCLGGWAGFSGRS